jgi:hypothetical protein
MEIILRWLRRPFCGHPAFTHDFTEMHCTRCSYTEYLRGR